MKTDQSRELAKHPAIVLVRDVLNRTPNRELYPKIIKMLGDNPDDQKVRDCYVEWLSRGYNPNNMAWLFDWYPEGGPPPKSNRFQSTMGKDSTYVGTASPKSTVPTPTSVETVKLLLDICPSGVSFEEYLERLSLAEKDRRRYIDIRKELQL